MSADKDLFDYLEKVFDSCDYVETDIWDSWKEKDTKIHLDDWDIGIWEMTVNSEHLGDIHEFILTRVIGDDDPIAWAGCYNDEQFHSKINEPKLYMEFKLKMIV